MAQIASVDYGYGMVKAVSQTGRRTQFPSLITEATGTDELAKLVGTRAPKYRAKVKIGDAEMQEHIVGEAALIAGASRSWQADASDRAAYPAMVFIALALLGLEGAVDLAVGVPLSAYFNRDERKALRRLLNGVTATVTLHGRKPQTISIVSVRVLPQALGAYFHSLEDKNTADRIAGQPLGIIDVGFRTTDFLLLVPSLDGSAVPDEGHSGSIDAGVGRAMQAVRTHLAKAVGSSFSPAESLIEGALAGNGHLKGVDLRPVFAKAIQALAAEIESQIRREWAEHLDYLSAILLVGGGGKAVQPHLTLPSAELALDSTYANALGFAELLIQAQYEGAKPLT